MNPPAAIETGTSRRGRWDVLVLVVFFGLLLGWRLGAWPLVNPDEGRYAEIPREMVVSGDWVTPRLDGVKYFEKPPLVYWLVAACYEVLGPGEWSMRLIPWLFALGGVLLTYGAARRMYDRAVGLMAATVLGTALFYLGMARILTLDMVVSVLMSATLFCFILGVRAPPGWGRRWLFYGVYAGAALATLSKGLIGVLVTGAVMFLWLLLFKQWRRLRPFYLGSGGLLFLVIATPWHVLAAMRNPDWAWFYFVHEHWLRFTTDVHGRVEPWWFFLPILWVGFFPWCGFIWPALRRVWRERWRSDEAVDRWFLVVWTLFILVFFSLSDSKLAPYILPVFPAVAVLVGEWLVRVWRERQGFPWRGGLLVFSGVAVLLGAALAAIAVRPELARLEPEVAPRLRPWLVLLALVLVVGAITGWRAARRQRARAARGAMVGTVVVFFVGMTYVAPLVVRPGTKALAQLVRREFRPGDQVFSYHEFFHDFPFYSGDLTGTVSYEGELAYGIAHTDPTDRSRRFIDDAEFARRWEGAGRVFVIVRRQDLAVFHAAGLPRVHLLGETQGQDLFSNQP